MKQNTTIGKQKWGQTLILALFCLLSVNLWGAEQWTQYRNRFKAALQALESNRADDYFNLAEGMRDYPLYPYLRYTYLSRFKDVVSESEELEFLRAYPDIPFADSLRRSWLAKLAKAGDWQSYAAIYSPQNDEGLQCYFLEAQLYTGKQIPGVLAEAGKLWLTGKSQPPACNGLFDTLAARGLITEEMRWQRIHAAMKANNPKLAAFLAKELDANGQRWVELWLGMHNKPAKELENFQAPDSMLAREILTHGLRRLAKKQADLAYTYWQDYQRRYAFSHEQKSEILRDLAVAAANQELPQALTWFKAVDSRYLNEEARTAWAQQALRNIDWKELLYATNGLSGDEGSLHQWRYWQGRALESIGQKASAQAVFRELAKVRDYYGFLAADRVKLSYNIADRPIQFSPVEESRLYAVYPGLLRAREFLYVDMRVEARREWRVLEEKMPAQHLAVAAALAARWGWHDRAILSAGKAGAYDDLTVRFPVLFREYLTNGAQEQNLDVAWIYGVTRQESAFMWDARSSAGALGLMQLMPATGKLTARKIGLSVSGQSDILDIDTNVRLGSAYLRQMLDYFNGNYMLATAAYNAGPGRVKNWAADRACLPADVWVELIPFRETRAYVRRVLEYTATYEARLGLPVKPLRLAEAQAGDCGGTDPTLILASRSTLAEPISFLRTDEPFSEPVVPERSQVVELEPELDIAPPSLYTMH